MQSWADEQQARLRVLFPGWDIWHVHSVYPKPSYTWHARPDGTPKATIDADSPESLIAEIRRQEVAR